MRRIVFLSAALLILISHSLSTVLAVEDSLNNELTESFLTKEDIFCELGLFADAITLVGADYVKEVTAKERIYGALDGMISSFVRKDSASSLFRLSSTARAVDRL